MPFGVRRCGNPGPAGAHKRVDNRSTTCSILSIGSSRGLRSQQGPKTLLGRAARYTWNNLRPLRRFLRDVRIPLDNNRAENALRLVALGRKNFLFVQSEAAGHELALLHSLVVSCTRVGVNPVEYLTDVLDRIDRSTARDLRDLLPDRWRPPSKPATTTDLDP